MQLLLVIAHGKPLKKCFLWYQSHIIIIEKCSHLPYCGLLCRIGTSDIHYRFMLIGTYMSSECKRAVVYSVYDHYIPYA